MNDEKEIRDAISENICKYRKKLGMSQRTLAEKMGVLPSRVSNWEQGINSPTLGILVELSTILGITLDEMFGIENERAMIHGEKSLLDGFRRLDAHGKMLVELVLQAELTRM